ncbi:MAG: xanthine dehydrogenase family protein subunit M [Anaerolineae bacterium]|nr:xanthine dehydrogenase family protein subunit M [Anaerolineae bacterium]
MNFEYVQPHTLPEALTALAQHGDEAKIIAGGTAVVLMLQQRLIAPAALISLGRVPDLDYIRLEADGLHIGPLTLLRKVEQATVVRERFPALARACGEVGNVRVRNQATLGGNLAEADYAADPPSMLLALNTSVVASTAAGSRTIPLSEFFYGFFTTALEPEEAITDIIIPRPDPGTRMAYLSYKSRSSEDRPCVAVSAVGVFDQGVCRDLRVAIGAACEIPIRLAQIEAQAREHQLSEALIDEIAAAYASNIETLDDLRGSAWYRRKMIQVHVRRALEEIRNGRR